MGEFDWFREHHVENMERMFAAVSDLYAEYWNDFFHFALFENEEQSWDEAFERTHRRYLDTLKLGSNDSMIELACGRGGFASFVASRSQARVLGVDISRAQLRHARRHKLPNLRFQQHDIMAIDTIGETFDSVAFMDADCYLPDKGAAVDRIARIMRPGGRLLLVAWCRAERVNALQQELVLEPFMRFWGVPSLETASGYRDHFRRSGLELIEEEDLNGQVRRNWEFGYEQAIRGVRELTLAKAARFAWKGLSLGSEGLRLIKEQFHAALYIKAAFDAGLLRYTLMVARRPD